MAASKAAKALRDGHGEMTLQMLRAEVLDDETEAFAERMRTESLARWPLGIEILGQPVSMGLVEATIPPPVIVVPTDETGTGGRILELRWPDGVLINVKFVDDQSDRGGVSRFLWTP